MPPPETNAKDTMTQNQFGAHQPEDSRPVCPRHPDRISYVTCQRCGRPVCGECQRPAAVGIQCIDCVTAAEKTAPTVRTPFGGVATGTRPLATYSIIAICVLVYALSWIPGPGVMQHLMYVPVLTASEPWRMVTSAFMHSQTFLLHIALNMYTLWIIGQYIEPLLGRLKFVLSYLICAIGGSAGVLLLAFTPQAWLTPVVGGSGAIFGLFGIAFMLQRKLGQPTRSLVILIAVNLAIGFLPGSNISWQAHAGGLVTGLLCGLVLAYTPRDKQRLFHPLGLAAVLMLLIVASTIKYLSWL